MEQQIVGHAWTDPAAQAQFEAILEHLNAEGIALANRFGGADPAELRGRVRRMIAEQEPLRALATELYSRYTVPRILICGR